MHLTETKSMHVLETDVLKKWTEEIKLALKKIMVY